MAELIAASACSPGARRLDCVAVVSLRTLPGDTAAQPAVRDAGLPWVDVPGDAAGTDPVVAWRAPRELFVVGRNAAPGQVLLATLAPGRHETALATDLGEAFAVFELHGPALDDWLAHLVDASAIPRQAGRASGCRLADVAVFLLRLQADRLWLLADRPLQRYLENWLAYTHVGATAVQREN